MRVRLFTSNFKREAIKNIISSIIFIAIIIFLLIKLTGILENKESEERLKGFFQEEDVIDVLLFGSSHVRHGIFPMELYRDYGIISYNLAGNGDTIPVSYWKLVMALEYQHPKLIIMDIYDLWPGIKTSGNGIGQVHTSLDAFPLSYNKYLAAMDLFDKPKERLEILWNYSAYHTRWTELTENDFNINYASSLCKGSLPLNALVERTITIDNTPDNELVFDEMSYDYLCRMIELCKDKEIEVLLINTGYDVNKSSQLFADSIPALAEKYELNYIDFTSLDIINFNTDLHSTGQNTHVNSSGARKLTDFIGSYLADNYSLPDKRADKNYLDWNENYKEYLQYKVSNIDIQNSLLVELTMLSDDDFDVVIYIKDDSKLLKDDSVVALIENISQYSSLKLLDKTIASGNDYLLVVDNALEKIWESENELEISTEFVEISYKLRKGIPYLYIQNMETNILDGEWYNSESNVIEPDIQIFIIDRYKGAVVSASKWNCITDETITKIQ